MKKMNQRTRVIISLILTVIFAALYFYFTLPAINIRSTDLYFFLITVVIAYFAIYMLLNMQSLNVKRTVDENGQVIFTTESDDDEYTNVEKDPYLAKKAQSKQRAPIYIAGLLFAIIIIGSVASSPIFHADAYTKLIDIETGNFEEDIDELSFDQIPWLDRASAQRLGDRKMGELVDMVSQFEVSLDYTQINYNGRPVRVTPLLYGNFFKWFNNFGDGIPGYITVDMVTQEAQVVRMGEGNGIKYSQSELFFRNIDRYIRFNYPTYMFETPVMEIDEDGHPYWICPKVVKKIGLFGGADIEGIVMVDAVTGEHAYYAPEDIPEWVDNVYRAELLIQQYDYYGAYGSGFLNSIFGQRGVTMTTDGYNYLAMDDDVYMYTGITSVGGDESNVGFVWINQRTKDSKYYQIAGAHEYSAMNSAEGALQHLRYVATFPLLLNVHGQPTYFMAMKDNSNLVKQYAMVNVEQYTIVGTGETLRQTEEDYIKKLDSTGISVPSESTNATGIVEDIRVAVIDGNSQYYIKLSGDATYYSMSASIDPRVVLINIGDRLELAYVDTETQIKVVQSFEWVT
ncbi:hypothetical protein MmiHf6_05080 [Methanimicrococcus hongohii]|uniref:CvpA family protein n=1 Tax=Methanimicrococcus hongohii TaxID=3028295 RepID=A0AA96UZY0_9EURY|nr:hypothetical protein [Methanimicrococcus sp. Hf6]WNY23203.1 hypothetical protein MmiHf6_05080 [Methanimicrococcus sp. Hf6]